MSKSITTLREMCKDDFTAMVIVWRKREDSESWIPGETYLVTYRGGENLLTGADGELAEHLGIESSGELLERSCDGGIQVLICPHDWQAQTGRKPVGTWIEPFEKELETLL